MSASSSGGTSTTVGCLPLAIQPSQQGANGNRTLAVPKDLVFELHYLGSVEYSFSLNFSRPAAPVLAQVRCSGLSPSVSEAS